MSADAKVIKKYLDRTLGNKVNRIGFLEDQLKEEERSFDNEIAKIRVALQQACPHDTVWNYDEHHWIDYHKSDYHDEYWRTCTFCGARQDLSESEFETLQQARR